jgi:hypothetical protein
MSQIFTNAKYADMLCSVLTRVTKWTDVDGGIFENV